MDRRKYWNDPGCLGTACSSGRDRPCDEKRQKAGKIPLRQLRQLRALPDARLLSRALTKIGRRKRFLRLLQSLRRDLTASDTEIKEIQPLVKMADSVPKRLAYANQKGDRA